MQLKTPDDLARMREAGRVVRAVLDAVVAAAVPGTTTAELDRLAEDRTRALGAVPAFKGEPRPVKPFTPSARGSTDADRARVHEYLRTH